MTKEKSVCRDAPTLVAQLVQGLHFGGGQASVVDANVVDEALKVPAADAEIQATDTNVLAGNRVDYHVGDLRMWCGGTVQVEKHLVDVVGA